MKPNPLYHPQEQDLAYALRYSWCGWLSSGNPGALSKDNWKALTDAWENDGLRLLEQSLEADSVLLNFSTTPNVTPVFVAARAKGRLEHTLRNVGADVDFSRKVAVRSIGDTTTQAVERYIREQVTHEEFVDPRFAETMRGFTIENPSIDLALPSESRSGRYWYNLHLVLVTDGRWRIVNEASLKTIRDGAFKIATKKGYGISSLAVMPDHVHIALRGNFEQSPLEIALAFQNNLAYMLNLGRIWQPGFYAGTFGEYNMGAVRIGRAEAASPATRGGRGRVEDAGVF